MTAGRADVTGVSPRQCQAMTHAVIRNITFLIVEKWTGNKAQIAWQDFKARQLQNELIVCAVLLRQQGHLYLIFTDTLSSTVLNNLSNSVLN